MSAGTDPTFYRSPAEAIAAPPERLASVAAFDPAGRSRDAMAVADGDPASPDDGQVVGWSELPTAGNELHHFGWNACSSALCHPATTATASRWSAATWSSPGSGRRGSRCWTPGPTPATPGWSGRSPPTSWPPRPATPGPTVHCGPGGSFVFDLGDAHRLVFEVRPAHDPEKTWGCVGVVISVEDLSGSVWAWHRDRDRWAVPKVLTIPAEPADPDDLPPALQPLGAVPPLISDLDLSVDDRWLSVSCWGTGERNQDDVSDIFPPPDRLGPPGRHPRPPPPPGRPRPAAGRGPQMPEVSRDGRRVAGTNSL
jgi:hypothetical protein